MEFALHLDRIFIFYFDVGVFTFSLVVQSHEDNQIITQIVCSDNLFTLFVAAHIRNNDECLLL